MYTCFRCAKQIRGTVTHHNPPLFIERLGLDFQKAYHPHCYEKEELESTEELHRYYVRKRGKKND